MGKITLKDACREHSASLEDIKKIVETCNLQTESELGDVGAKFDGSDLSVDADALNQILAYQRESELYCELKNSLQICKKPWRGKLTWFLDVVAPIVAAIAAIGSAVAAGAAVWVIVETNSVRSTSSLAESLRDIGDRIVDIQLVAARHSSTNDESAKKLYFQEAEAFATDLDTHIEIFELLYRGNVLNEYEWRVAVDRICGSLHRENYYGRQDIFKSTIKVCEEARKNG